MTATPHQMFTIDCTDCGKRLDYDDYVPYFDDPKEGRNSADSSYDWWSDGAKIDLCETCKLHEHAPVPDPQAVSSCARCGLDFDEHELASGDFTPVVPQTGPDLLAELEPSRG